MPRIPAQEWDGRRPLPEARLRGEHPGAEHGTEGRHRLGHLSPHRQVIVRPPMRSPTRGGPVVKDDLPVKGVCASGETPCRNGMRSCDLASRKAALRRRNRTASPPAPSPAQRSEPAPPAAGMSPAREEPHLLVGKRRPARGQGLQPKQPLQSSQQPEERPRAVHAAGDTALHPPPSCAAAGAAPGGREAVAAIAPLLRRTAPAARLTAWRQVMHLKAGGPFVKC